MFWVFGSACLLLPDAMLLNTSLKASKFVAFVVDDEDAFGFVKSLLQMSMFAVFELDGLPTFDVFFDTIAEFAGLSKNPLSLLLLTDAGFLYTADAP